MAPDAEETLEFGEETWYSVLLRLDAAFLEFAARSSRGKKTLTYSHCHTVDGFQLVAEYNGGDGADFTERKTVCLSILLKRKKK
jgi:hypothetical protein